MQSVKTLFGLSKLALTIRYSVRVVQYHVKLCFTHRAGLNRGVLMGRSTEIMGGSFRRGLISEMVTFSNTLAVQTSPVYKSNGEKTRCQLPILILSSDWLKWFYFSVRVQLYGFTAELSY